MKNKQMAILAMIIVMAFLSFGCLGQPYSTGSNQTGQAAVVTQNQSSQPQQNDTSILPTGSNGTDNSTIITPEPEINETEPVITPVTTPSLNMSISDFMSKRMDTLNAEGNYKIVSYQWISDQYETDPTAISINPTMQVLFDNNAEKNLIGLGFKTYTPLNGSAQFANGFAITRNESPLLESKYGEFEIFFNVPTMVKKMNGCHITSKETFLDNKSRVIVVYGFEAASSE